MINGTNIQIDVTAIAREARAIRAAYVRAFFSRLFSRRPSTAAAASASAPPRALDPGKRFEVRMHPGVDTAGLSRPFPFPSMGFSPILLISIAASSALMSRVGC